MTWLFVNKLYLICFFLTACVSFYTRLVVRRNLWKISEKSPMRPCLGKLKKSIPVYRFRRWFRPLQSPGIKTNTMKGSEYKRQLNGFVGDRGVWNKASNLPYSSRCDWFGRLFWLKNGATVLPAVHQQRWLYHLQSPGEQNRRQNESDISLKWSESVSKTSLNRTGRYYWNNNISTVRCDKSSVQGRNKLQSR